MKVKLNDCTNNTCIVDVWIEYDHISVMRQCEHNILNERGEFEWITGSDITVPYHSGLIKVRETPEEIIKLSKPLDNT